MSFYISLKTDKPIAEIGLYNGTEKIDYYSWQAHLMLAETIHKNLIRIIDKNNLHLKQIGGIVVYKGPGSFTGLRIGAAVANSLADSLNVQITGRTGKKWKEEGIARMISGENDRIIVPIYGAEANVTKPVK